MEEEDIGDGDGGNGLCSTGPYTHQDPGGQESPISVVEDGPDATRKINSIADHVGWASTVLVGKGHPEEVAGPLKEGCGGEEVGHLGDVRRKTHRIGRGRRTREE